MFVDATAIAAMMTDEDEARAFAVRMQVSTVRMTSPAVMARVASLVAAKLKLPLSEAGEAVQAFMQLMNVQVLAIPPRAGMLAIEAQAEFGAGAHPANLTADQCLVYVCARYYRQPLLFRDGGYAATGIETL